MLTILKKYLPLLPTLTRYSLFAGLIASITGCMTVLPKPNNTDSSMIIMSIEAERNLGTNKPDVLVISRQSDGKEFHFTDSDGKYFFFTNLAQGVYQLKVAAINIQGGGVTSNSGNLTTTVTTSATSFFPFDKKIIQASTTHLNAGEVAFMGNISAEGTSKMFPPGAIEITDVKLTRSEQEKREIYAYFREEFKDSPWLGYLK